ncbi:hypothetical protein B343_01724 [Francisella tularensis subsp. tularensis 80700075]|nr:hypothetical protein B343_01724 [Francisella tularensis subsp. tularensis 80700075]
MFNDDVTQNERKERLKILIDDLKLILELWELR